MDQTDLLIIESQQKFALILLPILLTISFGLSAILLVRNPNARALLHTNFRRWLFIAIVMCLAGGAITFAAHYFRGYALFHWDSSTVKTWYMGVALVVQGIVQKLIMRLFLGPVQHANPHSYIFVMVSILFGVFFFLTQYTDVLKTNMVYVVMPMLMALPLAVIYYVSVRQK